MFIVLFALLGACIGFLFGMAICIRNTIGFLPLVVLSTLAGSIGLVWIIFIDEIKEFFTRRKRWQQRFQDKDFKIRAKDLLDFK